MSHEQLPLDLDVEPCEGDIDSDDLYVETGDVPESELPVAWRGDTTVDHDVELCPGHEVDMTDIGQNLFRCVCGRVWTSRGNERHERGAFDR